MESLHFKEKIEEAWEKQTVCESEILHAVLSGLDQGTLRVATQEQGVWQIHAWVKKGILLYFKQTSPQLRGDSAFPFYDKVPLKFSGWTEVDFEQHKFRLAAGAIVRWGSFISPRAVIMPSFINIGAFIGEETMIDSNVRVGSCAQIGAHCHISDGVGIGGVLEPAQAAPVIIEDHCFIGARSQIVEGVHVEEGVVLGMGVCVGASTKIVERATGKITYGRIPAYSVVVPGTLASPETPHIGVSCAVIVKKVDAHTRSKTAVNELLREQ